MGKPFVCFLSGEVADAAEAAVILHARGIQPLYVSLDGTLPEGLPPICPVAPGNFTPDIILELTIGNNPKKLDRLKACQSLSTKESPLLSCSVSVSASEQASWLSDPANLVGFSYLPGQFSRNLFEIAPATQTARSVITAVEDFAILIGKEISVVQDRIGMVLPRVVCSLVNEAFFAIMEGAAVPADIDTAMKLGTNYPHGPVEWGNAIGLQNVVTVLDALCSDTGEDRYRVAPLLRQMALLQ